MGSLRSRVRKIDVRWATVSAKEKNRLKFISHDIGMALLCSPTTGGLLCYGEQNKIKYRRRVIGRWKNKRKLRNYFLIRVSLWSVVSCCGLDFRILGKIRWELKVKKVKCIKNYRKS